MDRIVAGLRSNASMTLLLEPRHEATRRKRRAKRKSRAKQPGLIGRRPHVLFEPRVAHAVPRLDVGEAPDRVIHVDDRIPVAECFRGRSSKRHDGGGVDALAGMPIPFPPPLRVDGG